MIYNIIDKRTLKYRWREINAIVEATSHDNVCADADQCPTSDEDVTYEQLENVTFTEAFKWANSFPSAITLYVYDKNAGTS